MLTQLGNFFIALALSASFIQLFTVIFNKGYIRYALVISYMTIIHFFVPKYFLCHLILRPFLVVINFLFNFAAIFCSAV